MLTPLEVLARYNARAIRVEHDGEVREQAAAGGGLAASVEREGLSWLGGVLHAHPGVTSIALEDDGVSLLVQRSGAGAAVQVRWITGEVLETDLQPAPHPGLYADGPLFTGLDPVDDLAAAVADVGAPLYAVQTATGVSWYRGGRFGDGPDARPLLAWDRPCPQPGARAFCERMGVARPYIAGAMAGGIGSAEIVVAMSRAGMLGFFGAGGLGLKAVAESADRIRAELGDAPAGFNLLHNPAEPQVEEDTVDLYLSRGVRHVSASAFMGLTPAVVRYRFAGARTDAQGAAVVPNRVLAKISRPEVAEKFLRPPPPAMLDALVQSGGLTAAEAKLAAALPVADALTVEADSGGHTDRRPLTVILPLMLRLRDSVAAELGYAARGVRVFVGAAGGLGTPASVHAAFEMGADYVLTGSINQAAIEAGTSSAVKEMLLQAGMADVAQGPAPDMFELGAEVQVLSRGTMYAQRSRRLYELYRGYARWSDVPEKDRRKVEKQILQRAYEDVLGDCEVYWTQRDPDRWARAKSDGRLEMALVFRWYLGMTSRWARTGEAARKRDFQIWCGPSMGAFNDWARGSALEPAEARGVVAIADALLQGAAVVGRVRRLAAQGVALPPGLDDWKP
ncbi:MAG: PfaD family polyunsaturated fatty acid/polyketide biosynthesis protein [Alphaproteobacteria bacterium]|nr:PfaD family polyunsaturated fatty acid/polyketide biosynthesis protein [Alphaproteobacteria bacterium]